MKEDAKKPAEKAEPIVYDGPMPDVTEPVNKILMEFFENPFNMKDGKPWLTSEDVKNLSDKMQALIREEVDSIYFRFEEKVAEEVEVELERQSDKQEKMDMGLTFKDAEILLEHLQGYRKLLEENKNAEQLVIELRQFEFRLSDRLQSKKYW